MWKKIRKHENSTANDLTLYTHLLTTNIKSMINKLGDIKYPWS